VSGTKLTVVDYGVGNLHSVMKAVKEAGADAHLTSDPDDIPGAERLLVPGVGAFEANVSGLVDRGLWGPVRDFATSGKPFMGICVGMQLLMEESEEFGQHHGFGILPGTVRSIRPEPGIKVPQIGWNRIFPRPGGDWNGSALDNLEPGTMVYFVHSFAAVPDREEDRLADVWYGTQRLSAAVRRDNVWGCQFHPEKSGEVGIRILRRFLAA
jgi:imidazole glycerol-phosphate synthase subunit HisH